jgi:hypothetical protein
MVSSVGIDGWVDPATRKRLSMFERSDRILLISGLWSENYKSLTMNVTYEVLVNL